MADQQIDGSAGKLKKPSLSFTNRNLRLGFAGGGLRRGGYCSPWFCFSECRATLARCEVALISGSVDSDASLLLVCSGVFEGDGSPESAALSRDRTRREVGSWLVLSMMVSLYQAGLCWSFVLLVARLACVASLVYSVGGG